MNYNILEFDSSNIKILNDIETISGKIKVNGVDKFQETSNFIISTSNILSTKVNTLDNTVLDTNSKIKPSVLPKSTTTEFGAVIVDGTTITIDSATGVISGSQSVDLSNYATKEYVDGISSGLTFKDNVKVATVGISSLSGLNDIDGVGVITGDRIFVFSQTNEAENGIYIARSDRNSENEVQLWTRATDFNINENITSGSFIFITNGEINGNTGYVCNISSAISNVGTDPITFSKFSSAGQIYAGDGILKNGNKLSLKAKTDGGIVVDTTGGSINLSHGAIVGNLPISKGGTGAANLNKLIKLGEHTTGNYVENITSGNGISIISIIDADGEKSTINLSVDAKANSGLSFDTDNKLELDLAATSISSILGQTNGGTGSTSLNTDIITEGTSNKFIVNNLYNAPLTVSGHILPSQNEVYNLGSPTHKWKSLYVASDTIHIGDTQLSAGADGGIEMSSISFADKINKITSNELHSLIGINKNVQEQINELNLDNITDGTSNKYIIDDHYNGTISVASNFNVGKYFSTENPNGNLYVYGDMTIEGNINTVSPLITQYHRHLSNYNIGYTDITNVDDTSNRPSIKIEHNVGYSNIMEISCKGDDGVFIITSNGNIGINKLEPMEKIDIDGNILCSGTINGITSTELSHLNNIDYNIKTRIDSNNINQSNYVLSTSNIISNDIIRIDSNSSNYTKNSSNTLFNHTYLLDQNTSNYIATIKSSMDNEHSSNYIKSTSNIIINRITDLNVDNIANGTTNRYIVDNIYSGDLTVSGDFAINGIDTKINSALYSSNLLKIVNSSANTALSVNQYDKDNDVFNASNLDEEIFKIKSNGNIGIGTNPGKKLEVSGDIKTSGDIIFSGKLYQGDEEFITSYWLRSQDGTEVSITSNVTITGELITSNLTVHGTTTTLNTDLYATEQVDIQNSADGEVALNVTQNNSTSDIVNFSKGSTRIFTINNDGNVGIGTATPSVSLHILDTGGIIIPVGTKAQRPSDVKGTIRYNDDTSQFEGYGTGWGSLGGVKDTSGDTYISAQGTDPLEVTNQLSFYSDGVNRMLIDSNGNIGIGTGAAITAPDSTLHVGGDINFTGILKQNGSAFQSSYWEKAGNNKLYYTAENVGIGTTNPAHKLHVNGGNIVVTSGRIGIGTTNPTHKLRVEGQIIATDKITSFYSDERLKTDIELIPEPLNIIEQLNGFYYKANELAESFGIETKKKEIGLSAQEVNKVLPELVDLAPFDTIRDENDNIVSKSGENYLTISYERLMPVIVESIKQLNNEIKLLKEENQHLKESIKKMS
tara:strand:+ start:1273 stop:5136 length:3864 start_codon:yes stop_codon:yes gene_type:complete